MGGTAGYNHEEPMHIRRSDGEISTDCPDCNGFACNSCAGARDPEKQRLDTHYNITNEDLDVIMDYWPTEWQEPVSEDELSNIVKHPPTNALVDTAPDQQSEKYSNEA